MIIKYYYYYIKISSDMSVAKVHRSGFAVQEGNKTEILYLNLEVNLMRVMVIFKPFCLGKYLFYWQ